DNEFEAVSASLKVPFYRTFARVTVPICMPAVFDIAIYMFVNALTTVSAVIFIYGATNKLASISVVHMDEAGATAAAAAMAALIVLTALAIKGLHIVLDRLGVGQFEGWRKRQIGGKLAWLGPIGQRRPHGRGVSLGPCFDSVPLIAW